ncbi:uncharacterized protein [Zea mays]|uniref:uncharacterized protein n=1 Tax=Zea mays TaxID=4577 RepID=UPI0009A9D1C3|nr:uncharacterized protein LOC109939327 [Zea mays]XP_020400516.1 uncharacterized protein LOC103641453 [Zea mays]|eukprot:XP_020394309.1 uncharacterized protein LOC109939327 [Zea mays]
MPAGAPSSSPAVLSSSSPAERLLRVRHSSLRLATETPSPPQLAQPFRVDVVPRRHRLHSACFAASRARDTFPHPLPDLLRPLCAQDAPPPPSQSSSLPPSSVSGLSHSMAWIWMVLVAAVVLLCRVVLCGPERAVHAPHSSDRRSRNMLLIVPHPDDKSMSVDLPKQNRCDLVVVANGWKEKIASGLTICVVIRIPVFHMFFSFCQYTRGPAAGHNH